MKALEFTGVIPPMLTAFDRTGEIDEEAIRATVRFLLPHVDGLYPLGTYGSGPHMTEAERMRVLEVILDEVAGQIPVVAHVGAAGTKPMIELAKHAKKAGASGVGAISPYYSPHLPDENLYAHFAALVDSVNEPEFPVFVYNNAHYSQNSVAPKVLARLAERGLRGCKDSSFDLVNFFLYQDAVAAYSDFNVIIGTEAIFMGAFDAGATGFICGLGNIYPEMLAEMHTAYRSGDRMKAMQKQRLVLRLRALTKIAPTVPLMHEVLRLRGVSGGYSRSPLIEISEEDRKRLRSGLVDLGLL
jgi:dihydrodipicolinate synthase/N-acetylneuraminate lyase